MEGADGADTFSFLKDFGKDTILDFTPTGKSHDVIDFQGNPVLTSFAAVRQHAVQTAAGVQIKQDSADTLMLNDVKLGNLSSGNFTFT
jgi:hypothetical protein